MPKLKLTASDGEVLLAHAPASWAEVPLAAYAQFVATARPLPASLTQPTAHAFTSPASCEALATLLGLPTAEPLLTDRRVLLTVYQVSPFLFTGPLPAAGAVLTFTHRGTAYEYCGGLPDVSGEQIEALLAFMAAHEGHPLGCGPNLLAVLYKPVGQAQTSGVVEATAEAFATLPLSLAWPALADFTQRSAPWLLATQRFLAARPAAEQALSALQQALASASPGRSWSMRRWLARVWLRLAAKLLTTSSLPSATTAPPSRPTWGRRAASRARQFFHLTPR